MPILIENVNRYINGYNINQLRQLALKTTEQLKTDDNIVVKNVINGFINYDMFNKEGEHLGSMVALPGIVDSPDFYPETTFYRSLYIKSLNAIKRFMGIGKSFMRLAQEESEKEACQGRVHLIAQNTKDIKDKPDIFYRKCGFDSLNKSHIEKIDECIREHKPLENIWLNTFMYLPLKNK